jgi:hemolysin III
MLLLYLSSTLYHALPWGRAKRVFQILDHSAIYLLIAGTYTPFLFGVLRGSLGWALFGVVWGMALTGIVLKSVFGTRFPWVSTGLYLFMGWLILVAIRPLCLGLPTGAMIWLAAGGLAYTFGVLFYAAERIRYAHFIWHLFVLAGTTCHCVAVLLMQSSSKVLVSGILP